MNGPIGRPGAGGAGADAIAGGPGLPAGVGAAPPEGDDPWSGERAAADDDHDDPEADAPRPAEPAGGTLWVVATPIGNLSDLSPRAAEVLRGADRVLAEDTRRTRALLTHLGIVGKPLGRFDAHSPPRAVRAVVERLLAGEAVALVTDAGTPSVSDPGANLVTAAAEAGARVVPVPGPSAVLAALAASGFAQGPFRFVGFLPRSGEARRRALADVASAPEPVVLFEAPGRLPATLADLAALQPARRAVVARELTKRYEEFVRGTLAELAALERGWRGEISLVLGPAPPPEARDEAPSGEAFDALVDEALARGRGAKAAADEVAARSGLSRREAYARVLARKGAGR